MDAVVVGADALDSRAVQAYLPSQLLSRTRTERDAGRLRIDAVDSYKSANLDYPWTGQAWTSIYTGAGKKYHGVTKQGFMLGDVNFATDVPDTIFDDISHAGLTLGSFRMPITYPARPVNGWMVSGFPTPTDVTDNEVWGLDVDSLPDGYERVKERLIKQRKNDTPLELVRRERERVKLVDELLVEQGEPDVLFYGTQLPDKMAHLYHQRHADEAASLFDWRMIKMAYTAVDESIAHFLDEYDPEYLLLVSDHGFLEDDDHHSMHATAMEYHRDGADTDAMGSILDIRDRLCGALNIDRRREVFGGSERDLTEGERDQITDHLEDLGYF